MHDQGPEHITQFELHALAFADMIESIANNSSSPEVRPPPREQRAELPPFSTIRCICGNNEHRGQLVCCHECHCYLHSGCVDPQQLKRGANFRCPFCRLQLDAVDPFRELINWIGSIDDELRRIHSLIAEAAAFENRIQSGIPLMELGVPVMRQRVNQPQVTQAFHKKLNDIRQSLTALMNQ